MSPSDVDADGCDEGWPDCDTEVETDTYTGDSDVGLFVGDANPSLTLSTIFLTSLGLPSGISNWITTGAFVFGTLVVCVYCIVGRRVVVVA